MKNENTPVNKFKKSNIMFASGFKKAAKLSESITLPDPINSKTGYKNIPKKPTANVIIPNSRKILATVSIFNR
jgi:hypothetical protein